MPLSSSPPTPSTPCLPKSPYYRVAHSIWSPWANSAMGVIDGGGVEWEIDDEYTPMSLTTAYASWGQIWLQGNINSPYMRVGEFFPGWHRLGQLAQYGTKMQHVGATGEVIACHEHTRYLHTLDVALHVEIMGRTLGLCDREIHLLVWAALGHDYATPSMGDIAKQFFGIRSEEMVFAPYLDKQIERCFSDNPDQAKAEIARKLLDEYEITIGEIHSIIRGDGFLWEVLDIADRFSYTLQDAHYYFWAGKSPRKEASWQYGTDARIENACNKLIREAPSPMGDIFTQVSREGSRVVFTNPENAVRILQIRANMHHLVYLNPHNWGSEYFIGLLLSFFVEQGDITYNEILYGSITEHDVDWISAKYGIDYPTNLLKGSFFEMEHFGLLVEAQARVQSLKDAGEVVFMKQIPGFSPGTKYMARTPYGVVKPLEEFFPSDHFHMKARSKQNQGYAVYSLGVGGANRLKSAPEFSEWMRKQSAL